jgi:hypothetical protein
LTEEPAEQAVRKAILASAGEDEAAESQPKQPPIPISEMPPKAEPALSLDTPADSSLPIPVTELPPPPQSADSVEEYQETETAENSE